jgi:hypothetical protein
MVSARIAALALAVLVLGCGSADAAGPLRAFELGFWSGGAYTDNRTGDFTHCSAGVAYDSGINMFVLVTAGYRWWLGFIDPHWAFSPKSRLQVELRLDGGAPFPRFATVPSGQLLLVPLPDNSGLIDTLRRSSQLSLIAQGESFRFELSDTSSVVDELTGCVRSSVALAASTSSAPSPTAASASSETKPAPAGAAARSETAPPVAPLPVPGAQAARRLPINSGSATSATPTVPPAAAASAPPAPAPAAVAAAAERDSSGQPPPTWAAAPDAPDSALSVTMAPPGAPAPAAPAFALMSPAPPSPAAAAAQAPFAPLTQTQLPIRPTALEEIRLARDFFTTAQLPNARLVVTDKPAALASFTAVWRSDNAAGAVKIISPGPDVTGIGIASDLIAVDPQMCKGDFAAARSSAIVYSSVVFSAVLSCTEANEQRSARYFITPRRQGGFVVFAVVGSSALGVAAGADRQSLDLFTRAAVQAAQSGG